jgi:hypothetical protein
VCLSKTGSANTKVAWFGVEYQGLLVYPQQPRPQLPRKCA